MTKGFLDKHGSDVAVALLVAAIISIVGQWWYMSTKFELIIETNARIERQQIPREQLLTMFELRDERIKDHDKRISQLENRK